MRKGPVEDTNEVLQVIFYDKMAHVSAREGSYKRVKRLGNEFAVDGDVYQVRNYESSESN